MHIYGQCSWKIARSIGLIKLIFMLYILFTKIRYTRYDSASIFKLLERFVFIWNYRSGIVCLCTIEFPYLLCIAENRIFPGFSLCRDEVACPTCARKCLFLRFIIDLFWGQCGFWGARKQNYCPNSLAEGNWYGSLECLGRCILLLNPVNVGHI